jgi:hypothetical protein
MVGVVITLAYGWAIGNDANTTEGNCHLDESPMGPGRSFSASLLSLCAHSRDMPSTCRNNSPTALAYILVALVAGGQILTYWAS